MPQRDPRPRCTCPACAACLTDEQADATRPARRLAVSRMVAARRARDSRGVEQAIEDYQRDRVQILVDEQQARWKVWQDTPSSLTVRGGYDMLSMDDPLLDWVTLKNLTAEVTDGFRHVVFMRPAQASRLAALVESMGHLVEVVPHRVFSEQVTRWAEAQSPGGAA